MELKLCPLRMCRARGPLGPARSLRCELRVAGGREPSSQVLEDVERETADQGDDRDFPEERQRGDEVHICKPGEHGSELHGILWKASRDRAAVTVASQGKAASLTHGVSARPLPAPEGAEPASSAHGCQPDSPRFPSCLSDLIQ